MNRSGYRDLIAWQKAMQLTKKVYQITAAFPIGERYGLAQQMRRAAVSVPSNIAEGRGRRTRDDYRHFLVTARGSLFELETQLLLSGDLGFAPLKTISQTTDELAEVARLLNGLLRYLTAPP
jgi:four helix bundle protein